MWVHSCVLKQLSNDIGQKENSWTMYKMRKHCPQARFNAHIHKEKVEIVRNQEDITPCKTHNTRDYKVSQSKAQ